MIKWQFMSEEAKQELGNTPEDLLRDAVPVKVAKKRQTYRSGDYYLKVSPNGGVRSLGELNSARLLKELGVKTVEYLAGGVDEKGKSIIISRAYPGAVSVLAHYYGHFVNGHEPGGRDFRKKFCRYVRTILHAEIFHPDFHLGNVLYSTTQDEFVLVDVYKVRKSSFFDTFSRYRMQRIVLELREGVRVPEMLKLVRLAGIHDPKHFYLHGMEVEKHDLHHEWPKRQKQILADYGKFIKVEDGLRHVLDQSGKAIPMDNCEVIAKPEAELKKMLLDHFYKQFSLLPHRRVAAVDYTRGMIWVEQETENPDGK